MQASREEPSSLRDTKVPLGHRCLRVRMEPQAAAHAYCISSNLRSRVLPRLRFAWSFIPPHSLRSGRWRRSPCSGANTACAMALASLTLAAGS
jgi:hypothetical protein